MATEINGRPPRPFHKALPPSKRVSYAKAMTVCIAAACRDGKGVPCIVLCSDSRLDYSDLGSTNTAVKLDVLGHGWCVQMAGDWGNVNHWKDNLKRRIQTPKAANVEQVARSVKESADYFMKSAFCEPGKTYQLLLSGFSGSKAVIMTANLCPSDGSGHSLTVAVSDSFGCIGSGGTVASALLSARECYSQMSIEYVSYLTYEAKRTSEKTGGVGAITVLALHSPGAEETADQAMVGVSTEAGKAQLEVYYRGLWKVPVVTFPDFPPEFFTNRSTQPNP